MKYTWKFACEVLDKRLEIRKVDLKKDDLLEIISKWKENSIRLNNMILSDAKKEFDANSKIGFGLGGDESVKHVDFEEVRGDYENNSFVKGLHQENSEIETRAGDMIEKLEAL